MGGFHISSYGFLNLSGSHLIIKKTLRVKYLKRVGNYSSACLDPFNPSILDFVKDLGKLQCTGKRYSSFINNLLAVKGEKIYSAHYRTIERPHGDDFKAVLSNSVSFSNEAEPRNGEDIVVQIPVRTHSTLSLLRLVSIYTIFVKMLFFRLRLNILFFC